MFWGAPVVEIWGKIFWKVLHFFFVFFFSCIFLNENTTKSHDFNTFRKLKEGATIVVSWEKWPKKESAYPKREMDTHRLQKLDIDYTVYIKDYKSQTYTPQSLLIDYKNQIICWGHPPGKFMVFTFCITKVCSVCFFNTKFVVCAFLLQSLCCALFETTKVSSVHFFIRKFVVHASLFQSCPVLPFHYKVCCVHFFRLQ